MRHLVIAMAALALTVAALPARASCPSTTGCPIEPQTGTQPCNAELGSMMESAARNELGDQGPDYGTIGQGCADSTSVRATMPCVLTKAISYAESSWRQFCASACGQSGLTVISFDCGYGLTQVTSGMSGGAGFEPLRVAREPLYNLGSGMKILAGKWRATPCVGDNQPTVLEHWYFATWAYNSFSWRNNPNNPDLPASRPPFNGPGGLSRGSYPYQEIVWGYIRNPPSQLWDAIEVSYPDSAEICNVESCRPSSGISEPQPAHRDPCQSSQPDAAVLSSEEPANPIVAAAGSRTRKVWRLSNAGGRIWSRANGYSFVRTSAEALGTPAVVDLPDGQTFGPGAIAQLEVELVAPASGSASVVFQLQLAGGAVGPDLLATVNVPTARDADGDGHEAQGDGGDDCDDSNPTVFPTAYELCDGVDQDCDGSVDEEIARSCQGACGEGLERCEAGAWGACDAPASRAESCNGVDDDCNGTPDDGTLCPEGQDCFEGACVTDPIVEPAARTFEVHGGCGCGSPGGATAPWALFALAAALEAKRRDAARRA